MMEVYMVPLENLALHASCKLETWAYREIEAALFWIVKGCRNSLQGRTSNTTSFRVSPLYPLVLTLQIYPTAYGNSRETIYHFQRESSIHFTGDPYTCTLLLGFYYRMEHILQRPSVYGTLAGTVVPNRAFVRENVWGPLSLSLSLFVSLDRQRDDGDEVESIVSTYRNTGEARNHKLWWSLV